MNPNPLMRVSSAALFWWMSAMFAALPAFSVDLSHVASTFALRTFHVDGDNCSDPLRDGSPEHPLCSIQDGVTAAAANDTVLVHKVDGRVNGVAVRPEQWNSYLLTSSLMVESGETLQLEPGVVVKMNLIGTQIVINGCLRALGDPGGGENSIYLTSAHDDSVGGDTNGDGGSTAPAAHDWHQIVFNNTSEDACCRIEHAEIRYAGGYEYYGWHRTEAVLMNAASPTVRDTTISNSFGDALGCDAAVSEPTLQRLTLHNNYRNGLHIYPGTITEHRTWANTDVAYVLSNGTQLTIGQSGRLTIDPGIVVKMEPIEVQIVVDGCLGGVNK